jgi:hypothetical protein
LIVSIVIFIIIIVNIIIITGFLIQSLTRKNSEKENDNDILNNIKSIKCIDHSLLAKHIADSYLKFPIPPETNEKIIINVDADIEQFLNISKAYNEDNNKEISIKIDEYANKFIKEIIKHNKIESIIKESKAKYFISLEVENGNKRKAFEKFKENQGQLEQTKVGDTRLTRRIGANEMKNSIFVDSLQGFSEEQEIEKENYLIKKQELRKQARISNYINVRPDRKPKELAERKPGDKGYGSREGEKGYIPPVNLSVYMPQGSGEDGLIRQAYNKDSYSKGYSKSGRGGYNPASNNRSNNRNNDNNNNTGINVKASTKKDATSGKDWKETGVHPSWAAKQLSKNNNTKIVIGTGTKVVFD